MSTWNPTTLVDITRGPLHMTAMRPVTVREHGTRIDLKFQATPSTVITNAVTGEVFDWLGQPIGEVVDE